MPRSIRRLARPAVIALVVGLVAACAGTGEPTDPTSPSTGASTAAVTPVGPASPAPSATPGVTPVPGGSEEPVVPPPGGTTQTPWGEILDELPGSFPVFPGAEPSEPLEGPVTATLLAPAEVDDVAEWTRRALEAAGFTTEALSSPLEDGSRVLDTVGDLPECRIQTAFRPVDGSTIITVRYGAGCALGAS